jgi:malate dehydrogenase (quinone)
VSTIWSYLVQENKITAPENFIKRVPHLSFVWGAENVAFLKPFRYFTSNNFKENDV